MSANLDNLINLSKNLNGSSSAVNQQAQQLQEAIVSYSEAIAQQQMAQPGHGSTLIMGLTVLMLAVFVGYYVVWKVTPALHSPLMAITNAISSVIIVGAMLAAGLADINMASIFGFLAVTLASINIFGGFVVTQRMLDMFSKKK